ncbi:hypothetical protein FDI21_gp074 [Pseudomonas phage Noxifer]|uniref:Uncharacterized protein n=1 Tax=Pseudomonas phage Noxifer TaxID=2006684 RepID=A0A1Y0SXI8_9CAUD|nr:hypothetical protein FDI21_gp074 [Pseudomonas phage Noxifer]ARV77245.1 hypothetical protein NOXIFER_74 [Pseudomonas phage Noxifer]
MSELIAGNAIVVPDQQKLEQFATLAPAEQQEVAAQVADMGAVAADEALKSDMGYDILKELYRNCGGLILNTAQWVIPVKRDMTDIKQHLTDPEGFNKGFNTLCVDISNYNSNLGSLYAAHKDKTGAPAPEDHSDVLLLADGYSKLSSHYEDGIQPLMQSLAATLEKEYLPVLEEKANATA